MLFLSAPNGDYSAAALQSVRDEVFISLFDEVLYETGVVSGAAPFILCSNDAALRHDKRLAPPFLHPTERQRQGQVGADLGGEALAGLGQDSLQHHLLSEQGEPRLSPAPNRPPDRVSGRPSAFRSSSLPPSLPVPSARSTERLR